MPDKGVIIKEVCSALDSVLIGTQSSTPSQLESTKWWTSQVLTALCRWGLRRRCWVGAAGIEKKRRMNEYAKKHGGEFGNEWLYDFTCLEYNEEDEWTVKRIPLVAECEWGTQEQINEDFEKLLLARADVRVMVFNGNYFRVQGKESIPTTGLDVFRRYIKKCEHTCTGDTYLFAARLHDKEDGISARHRFDYHLFVA